MKQRTLKAEISFEGIGLHTGKSVAMTIHPAPINHGHKFKRSDKSKDQVIPADVKYVISTKRGTTLQKGDTQMNTIEHVLAALVGMNIDNSIIEQIKSVDWEKYAMDYDI